ncbi:E3 ubiquitin-protein ligase RHA2A [Apostasia shenzhenica]|uniref:RING-type E3 ubiquitin transferase n=1 Tax=Apostasia shenzhenica TaxID=1088818 RepID=A0A2I0AKC0_9ASPA|nr:E3 ubiquitin-protein ligase RHA2A [Apostasia shenzhenica]
MNTFVAFVSQFLGLRCIVLEDVRGEWREEEASSSDDLQMDCCVCLSRLEEGAGTRKLPCHHLFHRECVDRWLAVCRRTCPLCRFCIDAKPPPASEELDYNDELVIWFSAFLVPGY